MNQPVTQAPTTTQINIESQTAQKAKRGACGGGGCDDGCGGDKTLQWLKGRTKSPFQPTNFQKISSNRFINEETNYDINLSKLNMKNNLINLNGFDDLIQLPEELINHFDKEEQIKKIFPDNKSNIKPQNFIRSAILCPTNEESIIKSINFF
ncbi:hypothetical protein BpHYR1_024419 [Brachionus plicatilis]|uniref:Uncharacterized protein n=1 Tax=Brachionus plicatilis TaxID=10195 RepID=A0A3M7QH96_BRAPC|nr:hypothetical protein BpHYR1_024419 [Brachionus plicatilis]